MKNKNIIILCKVVDNYGDIGVVYRLAKALSDLDSSLNLTIVCSNLESFSKMAAGINPLLKKQTFSYNQSLWTVLDWQQDDSFRFEQTPFPVVLECFQCGRPDWLENILFSETSQEIFHIFNIEYLTAEEYADDFHLLKCYTRKSNVKKMFFMPGFTDKTAGLLLDKTFLQSLNDAKSKKTDSNSFNVTVFSYERDFTQIFNSLNEVQEIKQKHNPDFKVNVLAANGKSLNFVKDAWNKTGRKVNLVELKFLSQEEWDKILCSADLNFVRGEESLARAGFTGRPFFWHAYVQDENYQLVKVNALLTKIEPFFTDKELFAKFSALWNEYNTPDCQLNQQNLTDILLSALDSKLNAAFTGFAENLLKNGNLAENLINYLESQGL